MTDVERLEQQVEQLALTQKVLITAISKLAGAVDTNNEMLHRLIVAAHSEDGISPRG
jgi:hypothetical protein